MQLISSGLRDHVYLATRLGAVFGIVQSAADTIFFDCILGNLQTRLRFLGLFLNAAGVDAVDLKIVVVAGPAREPNGSLVAAAVILGERREQGETGPVKSRISLTTGATGPVSPCSRLSPRMTAAATREPFGSRAGPATTTIFRSTASTPAAFRNRPKNRKPVCRFPRTQSKNIESAALCTMPNTAPKRVAK